MCTQRFMHVVVLYPVVFTCKDTGQPSPLNDIIPPTSIAFLALVFFSSDACSAISLGLQTGMRWGSSAVRAPPPPTQDGLVSTAHTIIVRETKGRRRKQKRSG